MNKALNDYIASKRVKEYPPILIDPKQENIWCGNDAVKEYEQYKRCSKCEHGQDDHGYITCTVRECVK